MDLLDLLNGDYSNAPPPESLLNKVRSASDLLDGKPALYPKQLDKIKAVLPDLERILETDYTQILKVKNIGWTTAEKVRIVLGIPENDPRRLRASVVVALEDDSSGDCWFEPIDVVHVMTGWNSKLNIRRDDAARAVELAVEAGLVIQDNEGHIWLPQILRAEQTVARIIREGWRTHVPQGLMVRGPDNLTGEQRQACENGLRHPVSAVYGAAGTGKTHKTIEGLESAYAQLGLTALTWKAAKRVTEVTEQSCVTVHKTIYSALYLLQKHEEKCYADYPNGCYTCESIRELQGLIVLVDEASMLDIELAADLFIVASQLGWHVVLVGDPNQLPPVGPGQVLWDIAHSDIVPSITLTRNFRSADVQGIVSGAQAVLAGQPPVQGPGLTIFETANPIQGVSQMIAGAKAKSNPHADAPIIAFRNKDLYMETKGIGERRLNDLIQDIINPNGKEWAITKNGKVQRRLRVGDPVVHSKTGADGEVSNGDQGIIIALENYANRKSSYVHTRVHVAYTLDPMQNPHIKIYDSGNDFETNNIKLAYALTGHKAQGSEFPVVIVCIPEYSRYCELSWLYTAITRASVHCFIVTYHGGLSDIVKQDMRGKRNTKLIERLKGEL